MLVKLNNVATTANGVGVIDVQIKGIPAVEVKEVDLPSKGPQDVSIRMQPVEMNLTLGIVPLDRTHSGLVTATNAFISQVWPNLSSNQGFIKFEYDDAPNKCIYVRPNSGFKIQESYPVDQRRVGRVDMPVKANTWYWLSTTATTGTIASGSVSGSTNNNGHFTTDPTYTVTFTSSVTAFSITAGDNTLTVTGSFGTGSTITIDAEKREIKLNGSLIAAGAWSGNFPLMEIGIQTIYKTQNNVKVDYTYTKRYRS